MERSLAIGVPFLMLACCTGVACSQQIANEEQATRTEGALPGATPVPGADQRCLPGERGYFRASLRGAIDAELDWRGDVVQCEGGARPDGHGVRVSFLGPLGTEGRRVRFVFGLTVTPGANESRAIPTNLTVILEGENLLYGTQGDDKCTVEAMAQLPLAEDTPAIPGSAARLSRRYRVAARGYCIDPAATLDRRGRLYLNRFDFAGVAQFNDAAFADK